jgi:hypothetical protein
MSQSHPAFNTTNPPTLDPKIALMKEDYEAEWWRAREHDEFNLKKKLMRVGCRPLKRKLLAC